MASAVKETDLSRRPIHLTTILASNIHCSSCVSHIQDVINRSTVTHMVICTNVSIVSGEIQILHDVGLPVEIICRDLSDAAFEVHSATTINEEDKIISEISYEQAPDGLLEEMSERWRSTLTRSTSTRSTWTLSTPLRNKRKRHHVANCTACQTKDGQELFEPSTPTGKGKHISDECPSPASTPIPRRLSAQGAADRPEILPLPLHSTSAKSQDAAEKDEWRCELSIGGMTCSSCSNAIHDGVIKLENVTSISVSLMSNSAVIQYIGDREFSKSIVETVEGLGYEASITRLDAARPAQASSTSFSKTPDALTRSQAKLSIGGMTCSSCTSAITDCLKGLPVVEDASVNLMTNSANVIFHGNENLYQIVKAIEEIGYECNVESTAVVSSNHLDGAGNRYVATSRSLQFKVEGFFCGQCPSRLMEDLEQRYHDKIRVDQVPTLKNPIITVTYTPDPPNFTARDILKAIAEADIEHFKPSVYRPPSLEERSRQFQAHERQRLFWRLIFSFILVIPTFVIGIVLMDLVPTSNGARQFLMENMWTGQVPRAQWALLFLATPVYLLAADVFHIRTVKEIRALWHPRSRVPIARRLIKFGSMNLLVSAGTTVAYVSSLALIVVAATTHDLTSGYANNTYFDSVVFLTFFILIGRYLEAYSKSKAGDAISLLGNLRPAQAVLSDGVTSSTERVDADLLEIGDCIMVAHGQSPAADGLLVGDSNGLFDESSLTGEARPVRKQAGDKVFTGTINCGVPVIVRVVDIGGTSMLDNIISVVREGQTKHAPVERIADVITGYFVPVITLLAIITFVVWISFGYSGALDPKYLKGEQSWAYWSLAFAIAVFVVACPCGIGLAAPTALFVGGGLAAKHGILARGGGQAFQDAGDIEAIVFDKTGTLTEGGDLRVTNVELLGSEQEQSMALRFAQELETASTHPLAAAIVKAVQEEGSKHDIDLHMSIVSKSIQEEAGRGMAGTFQTPSGTWKAKIGSPTFIASLLDPAAVPTTLSSRIQEWERESKTVVLLATKRLGTGETPAQAWRFAAIFAIEDAIRESARPAVEALRRRGLEVYMLSGDNETTAKAVAARVGIEPENVFAGVLPTEKAEKIDWLKDNLPRKPKHSQSYPFWRFARRQQSDLEKQAEVHSKQTSACVAFVGDGINDAPALTRADISISPCNGSSIAMTSSSFILMAPSLMAIPTLLDISTRVFRRVKFNFAWALVYNVVLIPVAAGILFKVKDDGWRLSPVWASLAMALSSVSVVVSSLLLKWEKPWGEYWKWVVRRMRETGCSPM